MIFILDDKVNEALLPVKPEINKSGKSVCIIHTIG